jgi:hypothetical protein
VLLDGAPERTLHVLSRVVTHSLRGGDSPLRGFYGARQVPRDDQRQTAFTGELNAYYDWVIAAVAGFDTPLILGPGEAKGELTKRLDRRNLGARVAEIQTADSIADPQLAAKIREHFHGTTALIPDEQHGTSR